LTLDVIEELIIPMITQLIYDPIPNIRFNVAKSYQVLIDVLKRLPAEGTVVSIEKADGPTPAPSPHGAEVIEQQILPQLKKLQQDEDIDVRYFAMTAANSVDDVMQTAP
jgi:serine/threonine-protein phosphatase 2A regulatory subunit A